MNANYTQAYAGLGKAYISLGEYEKAMDYFKLGEDKEGYAEAKAALRDDKVRQNFGLIAGIVIVALVVILAFEQIRDFFDRIIWKFRK
jgi:tetratricopeptide (TPR) repeat protein